MVPSQQEATPGRGVSNPDRVHQCGHHLVPDPSLLSQFQGNSEDPALHSHARNVGLLGFVLTWWRTALGL